MQSNAEADPQLIHVLLAAQASAVRDRIAASTVIDMLLRSTDMLDKLTSQIIEVAAGDRHADTTLTQRCAAAAQAAGAISGMLDAFALMQAQRMDTACQMADCMVIALQRLASPDPPSVTDLAALYCCEDQREVHERAIRQFAASRAARSGSGQ